MLRKDKKYVFADVLRAQITVQKDWVLKFQIHKEPHFRKVRKSNKLCISANLRNLFSDRPPLHKLI